MNILLKKYRMIIVLCIFVLLTRVPYLLDGIIPFAFDHGKDSLAIMNMILNKSPAFIGPWTSIPGLYFGPGWYYLLAPAFVLGGFNPVSAVYMMVLLLIGQVALAKKYFGIRPAILMVGAPFWLMISTSAWNPFPMTLVTLIILIILSLIKKDNKITFKRSLVLGISTGIGFHFSAAYAIFYPFAISAVIYYLKPRFSLREVLGFFAGVFLPFVPQLLFELKHNFVQTKAVINYFQTGEPHAFSFDKIAAVLKTTFGELTNSFLPEIRLLPGGFNSVYKQLLLLSLGALSVLKLNHDQKLNQEMRYYLALFFGFIIIPIIGFFFLHFNVWYVYPMMPVMVLLVAKMVELTPRWYQIVFIILLIITPVISYADYLHSDKAKLTGSRGFLPAKEKTLALIREKAAGKAFASYHYVPDIYDFSYQYLYFTSAYHGEMLPAEFSYMPDAVPYIVQKPMLLKYFVQADSPPELIFFVVEKPEYEDFLLSWWDSQKYSEIIEEIAVSDEVTLYVALP